jgi:uncharacterized alpha-E superfamily protein
MLSRVADAMFWMSRYLERAESIARLLDVGFHLELDLTGVAGGPSEMHWSSLLAILQTAVPSNLSHKASPVPEIIRWLTFDLENSNSILCCVNRARNNARSIRGSISPRMWRELNKLYLQLRDPEFTQQAYDSPYDLYQAVQVGSHLFQGVCDATLTRDEGWQFIQLGKYLERGDKTLRILNIKSQLLQDISDPSDLPLAHLHWAGVLRSCLAYEAFQRIYISRVDPANVIEFLLLQARFPRSVRFSLEQASRALTQIEGVSSESGSSEADRILGRVLSELRYCDLDRVRATGLAQFLEMILARCHEVGQAIQGQYSLR